MAKTLYDIIKTDDCTIKYYLTCERKSGLCYYGVIVSSETKTAKYSIKISDLFPYEHNAKEFLTYLHKHSVTPLSIKDVITEYAQNKTVFL